MSDGIIDIHTHLGDLLFEAGADLIEQQGVEKARQFDILDILERFLWPNWWLLYRLVGYGRVERLVIRSGILRNGTATRENMEREMARFGVERCVTMPVYPRVGFEGLLGAYQHNPNIRPFTGVDYANLEGVEEKFRRDVAAGACGLKLHPILQQVGMEDPRTAAAVEAFAPFNLPILFHAGVARYYLEPRHLTRETPELGAIPPCADLVKNFPQVKFIVGHAGLNAYRDVIELLGGEKNVWVDISFQPPAIIEELIQVFGPEQVLYASDWPWGGMEAPIRAVARACKGDKGLEKRIYRDNALELLAC